MGSRNMVRPTAAATTATVIPATSFHRRRRRRSRSCTWYDARKTDDAPGCASSGTVVSIVSCFGSGVSGYSSLCARAASPEDDASWEDLLDRLIGRKALSLTVLGADLVLVHG